MTQKRQSIASNTLSILFIRVLSPATSFLLFIYISRTFGPEFLGKYALMIVLFQIFQNLPLFGLQPYVVREISKDKDSAPDFITHLLVLCSTGSVFFNTLLILTVYFLNYPADILQAVIILTLAITAGGFCTLCESVLIGFERMKLIAYIASIENLIKFLISVALVFSGKGLIYLVATMAFTRIGGALCYLKIVFRETNRTYFIKKFQKHKLLQLFKTSPIFLGNSLLGLIYTKLDFMFISKLASFEILGIYTAAYRMIELCILVTSTLLFAIFPVLSRLSKESTNDFKELLEKTIRFLSIFVIGICLTLFTFSGEFIDLFYKEKFYQAGPILKILMIGCFFACLEPLLESILLIKNHQKKNLKILGFSSVLFTILLVILIPKYQLQGAAIAACLAAIVKFSIRLHFAKKFVIPINWTYLTYKSVITSVVIGFIYSIFGPVNLYLGVALVVTSYLLLLWIQGAYSFAQILKFISKKKKRHSYEAT